MRSVRSHPVIYVTDVERSAAFYELFGFERRYRHPAEGDAGYIALERGTDRIAVVTVASPRELLGVELGTGPRFELFVYVADVDSCVRAVRRTGANVLREPKDMPWGERIAFVSDPDGNPVALAAPIG